MWQSLMIFFTQECAYRGNRGLFLIFVPYICAQNVSGQKILRLKDCCYRFRKGISNLFLLYRIPKVPTIWNLGIRLAAPMVQPPRNGSSN